MTVSATTKTIYNVIDGAERAAVSGETIEKLNPATGGLLSLVPRSGAEDVDAAVVAAAAAQPAWARQTPVARGLVLRRIAQLLERDAERVAAIVAAETGKSHKDATGETGGAIEMGYFVAGEGRRLYGKVTTSAVPNRQVTIPRQPPGVLNVVQGLGPEAGQALVEDRRVAIVSFTGSTAVGRMIARVAGERLAKVCLELGGKNPLVVCDDADLDGAAEAAALSAYSNAGQRCAAGSRIIVFDAVYEDFKRLLLDRTNAQRVGTGDEDDLGPVINERQLENMLRHVRDAKELFGPVTTLHRVSGFDEAVELANGTPYGLTAAIWTGSVHRGQEFVQRIRSGVAAVNGPPYGSEPHWPFGGLGDSGTGWREPGTEALDVYSDLKTVHVTHDPTRV